MQTMNPIDIKAELEKAGCSQSDIARDLGVTPVSVHCVIFKGAVSFRIRTAIANRLGKSVSDIWPDTKPDKQAA